MKRNGSTANSPFFVPPKSLPGQLSIPMGTHHVCPQCSNSHICDTDHCRLPLHTVCPACGGPANHAQQTREIEYGIEYVIKCRARNLSDFYTFDYYTRQSHKAIVYATTGELVYAPPGIDHDVLHDCQTRVFAAQNQIEKSRQRSLF